METNLVFRPFEPQDVLQVAQIESLAFPAEIAFTSEKIKDICMNDGIAVFVFERIAESKGADEREQGAVVGSLFLKIEQFRGELIIISLAIHPEYRRKGLGRRALEYAQQAAEHLRATRILAQVSTHENTAAQEFFAAHGFETTRELSDFLLEGHPGLEMQKTIS